MTSSVAIIGAGQIGYAVWRRFSDLNSDCAVHARSRPAWLGKSDEAYRKYLAGDDSAPEADAIIDTIAFDEDDISQYDPDRFGRLIVISSASVYCDGTGRTLDEAAQNGFPEFSGPITEDQSTVPPGPQTYSTRKVRMEQKALELFGERATIVRPCAIYGPWSRHPREWWFVKRMLDGRTSIPLAHRGRSQFQTTSAGSIGAFAVAAIKSGLGGIYNLADETAPTVLEIGESIAQILGAQPELRLLEGASHGIGRTPWSVPRPFLVDGSKAARDGNLLGETYATQAEEAVRWLHDFAPEDWRIAFPQLAGYPWDHFDYAAEDAILSRPQ